MDSQSLNQKQEEMKRRWEKKKEAQLKSRPKPSGFSQEQLVDKSLSLRFGKKRRAVHVKRATEDHLHKVQKGCCAICKNPINVDDNEARNWSETERAHLDHDHTTGRYRGLLCGYCNLMLGFARDNPAVLRAAILYLKKHKLRYH